jgi:hypothetical protein
MNHHGTRPNNAPRCIAAKVSLEQPAKADVVLATKPLLTLQEVAVLLGVSDRVAMVAERDAFDRLRAIFRRVGVTRCNDLIGIDEELLDAAAVSMSASNRRDEYTSTDGWFRVNESSPRSESDSTLRDAVVNCAMLHLNRRKAWPPPVFFRSRESARYVECGRADGIAMYGTTAVFRSWGLSRLLKNGSPQRLKATAVLDMFVGNDLEGAFEVPVVMALSVQALS